MSELVILVNEGRVWGRFMDQPVGFHLPNYQITHLPNSLDVFLG
jgi:hypothetical protein